MVAHARLVPRNIDSGCIYRTLYADQTISEVSNSQIHRYSSDEKLFLTNKHLTIQNNSAKELAVLVIIASGKVFIERIR
jgi:hypothetical protein